MYDNGCNGVEKILKLFTSASSTNMHLFDYDDQLKKYDSVQQIIDDYFTKRFELYEVRKQYIISSLEKELVLLSNKARYINELLENSIDLRKKKKEEVIEMLAVKGYARIDDEDSKKDYKYLTKLPMDSVTEEIVAKINKEHQQKLIELETTKATTVHQMWTRELDVLKIEYLKHKEERAQMLSNVVQPDASKKVKAKAKKDKLVVINE